MLPLLVASFASAEPAFVDAGFVLDPPATGPFAGGINAPTVDVDPATGLYVLYFESQQAATDTDCSSSWVIGRATSPDGVSWTLDPDPVLEPDKSDPANFNYCSVSQPAVVYDGVLWHLFFAAAKSGTSSVNQGTGIGYAVSADGVDFSIVGAPAVPIGSVAIGLASATIVGDTLYLYYTNYPDINLATMSTDGTGTVVDMGVVMDDDAQAWSTTWLFGASAMCVDGETPSWEMIVGGDAGSVRSLGLATSGDGTSWAFDADTPLDAGTLVYGDLRHWDVLGYNGTGAYQMWYSMDNSEGLKAVGFAATEDASGMAQGRMCDGVVDGGDTGDTGGDTGGDTADTGGDTGDSGGDTGDDTGDEDSGHEPHGGHGCGCDGHWPWRLSGPGLAGMLLFAGWRRRGVVGGP